MAEVIENVRLTLKHPECNFSSETLNAIFEFDSDIGEILPYLNTVLGGFEYNHNEKILVVKKEGRMLTIRPKMIAITKVKDRSEAEAVLEEIKSIIKEVYAKKNSILPSYSTPPVPKSGEILNLLPKKDCKECGKPSCRAFAWDLYFRFVNNMPVEIEKCPYVLEEGMKNNYLRLKEILRLKN